MVTRGTSSYEVPGTAHPGVPSKLRPDIAIRKDRGPEVLEPA
jgi:hypothetical protein